MTKFLKGTIFVGIFLVPFIPFLVTPSLLFPFIAGKAFAFRIIVEIIFVAWLILALKDESYRPKRTWILGILAIFLIVVTLADFLGENSFKSFWSNFERMEGLITIVHLFLYFVVLSSFLNRETLWMRLLGTHVGASVIMAIYGLAQLSGKVPINQGGVRVDGRLGNATYLAVYVLANFFIALFLFARASNKKTSLWWFAPVAFLELYILYHTATRGAILGLIGGLIVTAALILWRERESKLIRRSALGALGILAIIIGGFYLLRNSSFVTESQVLARFRLSPAEIQSQGRYYIWPMALQGARENPILGWGQENISYVFNKYSNPKLYAQEQWFDRAHSVPLDWLIAAGILGLAGYLALFVAALFYIWRKTSNMSFVEKSVLTGFLSAYFFNNIFVFDNLLSYVLFFTILGYIHYRMASRPLLAQKYASPTLQAGVGAIAIIFLIFVLYTANMKPIQANQTLIDAMRAMQTEGPSQKVVDLFQKALSYNTFANAEIREQLAQSADNFLQESVPVEVRKSYFTLANSEYQKQLTETPSDTRYYVFYGLLLSRAGLLDQALAAHEKAHELSPGKQTILFDIAAIHINQDRFDEGLAVLKQASDLEPDFHGARILYAISALYAGKLDLTEEILSQVPAEVLRNDDRLIRALAQTGNLRQLLSIFEDRLRAGSINQDDYISYAAAALELGDRTLAISVLERLKEIKPELSEQVDFWIGEIRAGRNP